MPEHEIAGLALCLAFALPFTAGASGIPGPIERNAQQICESGSGGHFGHPSNACWIAHDLAVARRDYGQAVAYIYDACLKYRRGDFCRYASAARPPQIVEATVHGGADARGVARGLRSIDPLDIDDAEAGIIMREGRSKLAIPGRSKRRPQG